MHTQKLSAAVALHKQGNLDQAEALYLDLLKTDPRNADALQYLGMLNAQKGQTDAAIAYLQQALAISPQHFAALSNLGKALVDLQRFEPALEQFDRALQVRPDAAQLWHNRGNALLGLQRPADACQSYRRAIEINPEFVEAHCNLGSALIAIGQIDAAMASLCLALEIEPNFAEAHYYLGNVLKDLGQLDEAVASYRRALEIKPDFAEVHSNLGGALIDLEQLGDAVASFRLALEIKPDFAEAHYNLGNALKELGQLDNAVTSYRQALGIKPDFAEAHNNLGDSLEGLGRLDDAVASFRRALEIKPDYAEAHSNLGNALRLLGQLDDAAASFRRALKIKSDFAEAHYNLGNALNDLCQHDDAMASFRRALGIKPDYAEAHNNLGSVLLTIGQLDNAVTSYRHALEIKPDYVEVNGNLLFARNYLSNQPVALLLAEARRFGDLAARKASPTQTYLNVPEPGRCLRVGLVSGDFYSHPVGYFIENVLAALASLAAGRVKFIAYSNHFRTDALTERIKTYCHGWHSAVGLSDAQLSQRIRDDGIDILIDLSGHTAHNRLPMFAWKPAPVQASWLGYFATTGVAAIDYLIADPWTLPESEEVNFTEKIWRLPETRLCFTPPDVNVDVSPLPALANGLITFGCFNNLSKMNDTVVALWAKLLNAIPQSRLFLKAKQLNDAAVRQNVIHRFAVHDIAVDRLVLEGSSPRAAYLSAYHRVDIALDPFPFPGGATTAEALWMGVPVLTLTGERFLARQGVGLLMNAGLPDWIAADADDYVARAVSHAGDLQRLAALRKGLRQQVLASPLFDAPRFARHFETALRGMWTKWCNQQQERTMQIASATTAPAVKQPSEPMSDLLTSAVVLHKQGNLGQAEALYLDLLKADPRNADALQYLGMLNAQKGQTDAAIAYLQQALASAPQHFAALCNLGMMLTNLQRYTPALEQFDRALQVQPDSAQIWYSRGNVLKNIGQFDDAIASYRRALEIKPDLVDAHYVLGNTLRRLGQHEQAMESYRRVLAINPDFTKVHYDLGNASGISDN
jgi:protein O-GlcNAc transferase